jgi:hypothetical protein
MATLFELKAKVGENSYYRVVVVDMPSVEAARSVLERFVASDGSVLLTVDKAATREVDGLPSQLRVYETPDGRIAASGQLFVLRRFAKEGFSEALSMEYAGLSADAAVRALAVLCDEEGLLLIVMGVSVPGATRLRCGLRSLWILTPGDLVDRPAVRKLVDDPPDSQYMFLLPASERGRIRSLGGPFCSRSGLGKAFSELAPCIVEGGDVLCREGYGERVLEAFKAPAAPGPPTEISQGPQDAPTDGVEKE